MTLPHRLAEYDSPAGAQEYLDEYRKAHRKLSDRRERRILERFWERMRAGGPLASALDLPCGWGRYLDFLCEEGTKVIQSDYSGEMLRLSARLFADKPVLGRLRASGSRVPLANEAVDVSFSMRLNHHIADPTARRDHLKEVLRVARRYAVFSYFDAATMKNRLREARIRLGSRKRSKNALSRGEVFDLIRQAGFRVLSSPLLFPMGSGHRLVLAERVG